jgi:hypothetical protein
MPTISGLEEEGSAASVRKFCDMVLQSVRM